MSERHLERKNSEEDIPQKALIPHWSILILHLLYCCIIIVVSYFEMSPLWIILISVLAVWAKRKHLKALVKQKTVQNLAKDEKKFISHVTDIPPWVHFNEVETTEWINVLVNKMWPLISFTVKDILKTKFIPMINSILPTIFQPCKLFYFNLGDVSPRIAGVKVMSGSHATAKEILVDLDLYYNGNTEIKLQIGRLIRLTAITAGVKNIEIIGKMRIFLYPVKGSSSLIGAIAFTFLNKPKIRFDLSEFNLLKTPGLSEAIKGVLNKVVGNAIVLPNRLHFKMSHDVDLFEQLNPLPQGILKIHVIEARNLQETSDFFKEKLQPYCIFTVGSQRFYTRVVKCKSENAIWNEHFEALVHQRQGQTLKVDVFSISTLGNSDLFLGTRSIDLLSVWKRGSKQMWLQLEGVKSGLLLVSLTWYELTNDPADISIGQDIVDADISDAFLAVYLESAEHLEPVIQGKISPYAILRVDDQEYLSKVERDSFNPTWTSSFNFRIYDLSTSTLNINIKDYDSNENLGTLKYFVKHLLHKENMSTNRSYSISENLARLKLHLRLKALRSRASILNERKESIIDRRYSTAKSSYFNEFDSQRRSSDVVGINLQGIGRESTEDESWKEKDVAALKVNIEYSLADELVVTIIKGFNFEILYDDESTPQTFVCILVEPGQSNDETIYQTPVKKSFYPIYNETFIIKIRKNELPCTNLRFIIKDKMPSRKVTEIGQFWFYLCDMDFHKSILHWFTIFPPSAMPPETEL